MRKISQLVEVRDRTTLLPGEVPVLPAPLLGGVVDALFALRENPQCARAKIKLSLMRKKGECACPSCGDEVTLEGFRRTRTHYAIRDEWSCRTCSQRFLLCEENLC